jgi:hypothetical protein
MASISGGDKLESVLKGISANLQLKMNVGVLSGSTNEDTGEPIAPMQRQMNMERRPFQQDRHSVIQLAISLRYGVKRLES